jgi:hypothetical protein
MSNDTTLSWDDLTPLFLPYRVGYYEVDFGIHNFIMTLHVDPDLRTFEKFQDLYEKVSRIHDLCAQYDLSFNLLQWHIIQKDGKIAQGLPTAYIHYESLAFAYYEGMTSLLRFWTGTLAETQDLFVKGDVLAASTRLHYAVLRPKFKNHLEYIAKKKQAFEEILMVKSAKETFGDLRAFIEILKPDARGFGLFLQGLPNFNSLEPHIQSYLKEKALRKWATLDRVLTRHLHQSSDLWSLVTHWKLDSYDAYEDLTSHAFSQITYGTSVLMVTFGGGALPQASKMPLHFGVRLTEVFPKIQAVYFDHCDLSNLISDNYSLHRSCLVKECLPQRVGVSSGVDITDTETFRRVKSPTQWRKSLGEKGYQS